jgi:hypothetical protein
MTNKVYIGIAGILFVLGISITGCTSIGTAKMIEPKTSPEKNYSLLYVEPFLDQNWQVTGFDDKSVFWKARYGGFGNTVTAVLIPPGSHTLSFKVNRELTITKVVDFLPGHYYTASFLNNTKTFSRVTENSASISILDVTDALTKDKDASEQVVMEKTFIKVEKKLRIPSIVNIP